MVCLRGTSYVLMLNGRMQGGFRGVKSLHQGDPISPLLFILIMEYLTRLLQLGAQQQEFRYHPLCKGLKIINLCFADDLVIFCKANSGSVQVVKQVFEDFCNSTDLKANISKSHVFFGGVSAAVKDQIIQILQLDEGTFPLKYLGIPMRPTKWKMADCGEILKKIKLRLHTWASRHLSYAGRIQLITSVLLGLRNYWMNIFLLPQSIVKEVDKIFLWFLWGNNGTRSNFHLTPWSSVCLPKRFGGLGFGEGTKWNKAMLAKYIWAINHQPETLWVKWVNTVYLKGQSFWQYHLKADTSWYWRKICHLRDVFSQKDIDAAVRHGRFKVGLLYMNCIHQDPIKYHPSVWNRISVPKHRFITWQAVNGKLLTRDHLHRVLMQLNSLLCPVCELAAENHEHLFFYCNFSQQVVQQVQLWLGRTWPLKFNDWSRWIENMRRDFIVALVAAVFSTTIYYIWYNRNSCFVNHFSYRVNCIVDMIKKDVSYRSKCFTQRKLTGKEWIFVRKLSSV
ncbi:uncharacterized protein LOC133778243 [Humulus lupulus]|uniref:uncharacterized protein LOC133778243 n=1 Tax=Humulus lupulus TaxID=3486 RepID=UPI002B409362|nr:uncharacterized protein LOC133778243 [Humulus lupulus]